jgi:hypothetical protein
LAARVDKKQVGKGRLSHSLSFFLEEEDAILAVLALIYWRRILLIFK